MSTGTERARERAGHLRTEEVQARGMASAIHELGGVQRAVGRVRRLAENIDHVPAVMIFEALDGHEGTPRKSDPEMLDDVAKLIARRYDDPEWRRYLDAARAVVDYLQAEGVIA
ncbi:hypothetical protein ACTHQY_09040 [Rhodococcoides corynebacterioides]|uniref:hypothetical protein n=1 Tax=Rhodococcoides corynebacterioides TaxID=53972 RepID=UPI003F8083ED